MKVLPLLLLNLATVGVGILVYDHLRDDSVEPGAGVSEVRSESASLEPRVEALEAERRPMMGGGAMDPRVVKRLDALEEMLREQEKSAASTTLPADGEESPADAEAKRADPDQLSEAEVKRWRKVRDAARRLDTLEKNRKRFDLALDKLSIPLTPRQRDKIHAAYAAFEPRVSEIWREIKTQAQETVAAGGTADRKTLVQQGMAQIEQEFAGTLTGIVHAADAEAVAGAVISRLK